MERLFKENKWANGENSDYTLPGESMGIIAKPGLSDGEILRLYVANEIRIAILEERKRNDYIYDY